MKTTATWILLLWAAMAAGCSSGGGTSSEQPSEAGAAPEETVAAQPGEEAAATPQGKDIPGLVGFYVGAFEATKFRTGKNPSYSNRINLAIDHIGEGKVEGHSVVAGNSRPFSGTYTLEGSNYRVQATEPGDDRYDGKFTFVLDPGKKTATGTWVANDKNLAVYEREYALESKVFSYDPNLELPEEVGWTELYSAVPESEFEFESTTEAVTQLNPSKVKLRKEDVENMFKGDLEIMRNSIYARHGYSFKNRKMRYVFDRYVPWYIPMSTDVSHELTQVEQENIALIKRYEQHAATYYDSFGR